MAAMAMPPTPLIAGCGARYIPSAVLSNSTLYAHIDNLAITVKSGWKLDEFEDERKKAIAECREQLKSVKPSEEANTEDDTDCSDCDDTGCNLRKYTYIALELGPIMKKSHDGVWVTLLNQHITLAYLPELPCWRKTMMWRHFREIIDDWKRFRYCGEQMIRPWSLLKLGKVRILDPTYPAIWDVRTAATLKMPVLAGRVLMHNVILESDLWHVARFVARRSSLVARGARFVARRSWHVARFVARRSSFVARGSSLVARGMWLVACRSSLVARGMWLVSSLVARGSSLVARRSCSHGSASGSHDSVSASHDSSSSDVYKTMHATLPGHH